VDAPSPSDIFVFGDFRLDRRSGGLFRCSEAGNAVHVTIGSRALDVLGILIARRGDLVSREEIMGAVWPDTVVEKANLAVQISALRRVLDQDRSEGSCIQTVPGRGYRFVAAATRLASSASEIAELTAETVPDVAGAVAGPAPSVSRKSSRATVAILILIGLAAAGSAAAWLTRYG
jgi:DNA-binding winged helix-turn-helix (wHTH) protein